MKRTQQTYHRNAISLTTIRNVWAAVTALVAEGERATLRAISRETGYASIGMISEAMTALIAAGYIERHGNGQITVYVPFVVSA